MSNYTFLEIVYYKILNSFFKTPILLQIDSPDYWKVWLVPIEKEFIELVNFLGGRNIAAFKMKNSNGRSNNDNGNNANGFSRLPGVLSNY